MLPRINRIEGVLARLRLFGNSSGYEIEASGF
jgi:hypothetical protein